MSPSTSVNILQGSTLCPAAQAEKDARRQQWLKDQRRNERIAKVKRGRAMREVLACFEGGDCDFSVLDRKKSERPF